jgi:hypothetical protein
VGLRTSAAQGASALEQHVELLLVRDVAFGAAGIVEQTRQVDEMRNALFLTGQELAGIGVPKPDGALPQVIPDAEEVVDLAKALIPGPAACSVPAVATADQHFPPAIRRAVGEGSEDVPIRRGLKLARGEGERWVERVAVSPGEVSGGIGEGGRLDVLAPVRPEPTGEDVLASELD